MKNIEIWKNINGYEGLYQVSNFGKVKSFQDNFYRHRDKILKQYKDNHNYLMVALNKNKIRKTAYGFIWRFPNEK